MSIEISIVMSVYNAESFLKESIESILNQTHENFEFIIINDGSTDNSLEIIKSFRDNRIVLIDQKNQGLSKSLNNGINIAKNELIARMDADDISFLNRLENQIEFMLKNPACIVLGTNADIIDLGGNYLYTTNLVTENHEIKEKLPEANIMHSSAMFRKSIFNISEKYPEEISQYFDDKILWNKMSKFGELRNLSESLIKYRIVPNSMSNLSQKKINLFRKSANEIISNGFNLTKTDLIKLKSISDNTKNERFANYYLRLGNIHLKNANHKLAIKNLSKSLKYSPFNINTWFNLVFCLLPPFVYLKLRKIRNV